MWSEVFFELKQQFVKKNRRDRKGNKSQNKHQKHYYDKLILNFRDSAKNLMREPANKQMYALDMYWKRLQQEDKWFMITPPTVTQYENYSDIEERNTNYDHLMLDMNKEWLFTVSP